jgi:hypothetical protein
VLAQSLNSTAPGDHVTTPPRGDLARQVLTLAQDLAVLARRLDDLGDTAALRAQVTGLARRVAKLGEADPGAITELATAVHGLTGRIAALEDALSQHGPSDLWDFTGLPGSFDGDARLQAWEQLREWVRDVLGGVYQLAAASGAAAPLPSGQAGRSIPTWWPSWPGWPRNGSGSTAPPMAPPPGPGTGMTATCPAFGAGCPPARPCPASAKAST